MNDLFSVLVGFLKETRSKKTKELEQGSLVNNFLRKALLSLNKLTFSEMVTLWKEYVKIKIDKKPIKFIFFKKILFTNLGKVY